VYTPCHSKQKTLLFLAWVSLRFMRHILPDRLTRRLLGRIRRYIASDEFVLQCSYASLARPIQTHALLSMLALSREVKKLEGSS
jgi:hypothetical protein